MARTCEFQVDGMHCASCELFLEQTVKKQAGVEKVVGNSSNQKVTVTISDSTDVEELKRKVNDQIQKQGYRVVDSIEKQENNAKEQVISFLVAAAIVAGFLLLQKLNINALFNPEKLTYTSIFILGIFASLSTCMVVVGGIAMTMSSRFAEQDKKSAILVFHVARLIGFVLLGGVIGLLGKVVVINATTSNILRIVVALIMGSIGADMIGIHLPKLVMPKQISEYFGVFDDKEGWTSAVLLGIATFFMPCAFTQSMQLYSVGAGSFVTGALVMGTFALGTLPVLGLVSFGSVSGAILTKKGVFSYTMGYLILLFALLNIVSSLGVFGVIPLLSF